MARPARKFILIPEYRPLFAMQECFGPQHGPLKEPCPTPIPIIGKLLRQTGDNKLTIYEVKKNPDRTTTPPVLLTLDNYTLPYDEIAGGKKVDPGMALESTKENAKAVPPVIGNLSNDSEALPPEPVVDPVSVKVGNPSGDKEPSDTVDDAPTEESDVQDEIPETDGSAVADAEETASQPDQDAPISADDTDNVEESSADVDPVEESNNDSEALPPEPTTTVTSRDGVEIEGISPKIKPYDQMSKKERKEARRKAAEAAAKSSDTQE